MSTSWRQIDVFIRSLSSDQIPKVRIGFAEGGGGKVGLAEI